MMNQAVETARSGRKLPRRYGIIDQRLVNDGYLRRLPAEAVSLYVFLCVVADRSGRSWYSDGRLVQSMRLSSLAGARRQLVDAGLVAWEPPVYTVLALPEPVTAMPETPRASAAVDERPATAAEVDLSVKAFRRKMGWSS